MLTSAKEVKSNSFITSGILFGLTIALGLLPTTVIAEKPNSVPNIILIVADYMGYSDIEPYGAKDIQTPALSTLASQGVRFTNHYSAAPTCIPSRASLMSGQYPSKVLKRFNADKELGLPAEKNTLISELKAAGYKTALIGKWHLGTADTFKPRDHGFDYFFGFNSWTLGYHDHLTSNGEPGLLRNEDLVIEDGYLTDLFTTEATQFIEKSADDPFFLYLSYNAGLPPYQGPKTPKSEWGSGWNANDASRDDYIKMVESMDQGISKVLNQLKTLNLEEKTLIIFTYDHGGRHLVNSSPLFHGFATLWEGGIRVPLIIRWPNHANTGRVRTAPTIAMDLTATMLDIAGRNSAVNSIDGISLIPSMDKIETSKERVFFWQHGRMKAARQANRKYVVDDHSQLLFDLDTDIGERRNLFAQHPEITDTLRAALADWEKSLSKE